MIETTTQFNIVEGLFWILLGLVLLVGYFRLGRSFRWWAAYSTVTLIAFGVSDFMQVLFGSFFLPGMQWLLVWKILNVFALVVSIGWYLIIRYRA